MIEARMYSLLYIVGNITYSSCARYGHGMIPYDFNSSRTHGSRPDVFTQGPHERIVTTTTMMVYSVLFPFFSKHLYSYTSMYKKKVSLSVCTDQLCKRGRLQQVFLYIMYLQLHLYVSRIYSFLEFHIIFFFSLFETLFFQH